MENKMIIKCLVIDKNQIAHEYTLLDMDLPQFLQSHNNPSERELLRYCNELNRKSALQSGDGRMSYLYWLV